MTFAKARSIVLPKTAAAATYLVPLSLAFGPAWKAISPVPRLDRGLRRWPAHNHT